jgi:hypothetical protein
MNSEYSPQEEYLLKLLRSLKPYERIEIVADKEGKPNRFLIIRSQKIMVSEIKIEAIV